MKIFFKNIFYSFPIQLFILHFRKYQSLLFFWFILTSTVSSGFMKSFGADALFFSPEYLGKVSFFGAAIVGVALGIFIMSWHITTFILHTHKFKFLATTNNPFLKYCINNSLIPFLFLIYYFYKLTIFDVQKELMAYSQVISVVFGVLCGIMLLIGVSFAYFFTAQKTIFKPTPFVIIDTPKKYIVASTGFTNHHQHKFWFPVHHYFNGFLKIKRTRQVTHYSPNYLDSIFKRHHLSAIFLLFFAFCFLVIVGFFLDYASFQLPAASSILMLFAILIALFGALSYFLQSWSFPIIIIFIFFLNLLYKKDIIDPRNKAYGLNYTNIQNRPLYNKDALINLCTPTKIMADKQNMLSILEKWKAHQLSTKPILYFINVSGGGLRSATFVMNTLQQLDSIAHFNLMKKTFLISGASGGMLSATYYRELYKRGFKNLHQKKYCNQISEDLLNPIFTSMIARDLFAPAQKFLVGDYNYVKDRGYAFEEKLNKNSRGILNGQIKDYKLDEENAHIPLMIFNSTISMDGRKMMTCTQPISFMMKPMNDSRNIATSPDAIDFCAFFAQQQPQNLRLLTALRMNATFPYVLPNVWLPTVPVIDVMDAGLRDNFGEENTLRFIENFDDWIADNTSGVVIIQLRDRANDYWETNSTTGNISDIFTKPGTMLQNNWFKLQDYSQAEQFNYLQKNIKSKIQQINFMYLPKKDENVAALNFHLTASEKKDVIESFNNRYNQNSLQQLLLYFNEN